MGRGRGKGRKLTVTSHEDRGSGGEEPVPVYRRRGRPQKTLKDDISEEEAEKIEAEVEANGKHTAPTKEIKHPVAVDSVQKRKRYSQVKENLDSVLEENGASVKSNSEDSTRTNGFRQNGSRRKNKPRCAAGAGVECK